MRHEYHDPVLLQACLEGLNIRPDGVYVDATFGGGGHSRAILERLGKQGRLIAFDRDRDAWENAPKDERFTLVRSDFRWLKNHLRFLNVLPVDGLLADLGVSSHQFDTGARGFSFRFDGPLDMRMDGCCAIWTRRPWPTCCASTARWTVRTAWHDSSCGSVRHDRSRPRSSWWRR
jgi:16S rRNA (cytosine1402-N4)-methyltransferase